MLEMLEYVLHADIATVLLPKSKILATRAKFLFPSARGKANCAVTLLD